MLRLRTALAALAVCTLLLAGCGGNHPALHGGRPHSPAFVHDAKHAGLPAPPPTFSAIPQIPGYDAVTLSNIPGGAQIVGCYVSGRYANCGAAQLRFPHAQLVTIATWAGAAAKCLDVEPGDAVPSQTPGWVHWMLSRGVYRPCVYSDASEQAQVRGWLSHAGIPRASFLLWLADWDGNPTIPPGFDAKQWFSNSAIDRDSFATYFLAKPPKPLPVCFTHRETRKACQAARATIARDLRAEASSQRAYLARACDVLAQRERWFASQLRKHPRVRTLSRRRALAASRRAYRQRSCSVFAGRVQHFGAAAARVRAGN